MPTLEQTAWRLRVRGLVQGVGFRPCVHRLATSLELRGWVANDGAGVLIHLEGDPAALETFRERLVSTLPIAARIESLTVEEADIEEAADFCIRFALSPSLQSLQARVPTDRAICGRCRVDILDPANRRYLHAFATCTECGPRYSIVDRLPYERNHTAMHGFRMCHACGADYADPGDRRFHAEPIACPKCGPQMTFSETSGTCTRTGWQAVIAATDLLRVGKILALKGLGGYQLLVRADDQKAVLRLRERKHRPTKPFAIMVRTLEQAQELAVITPRERELLLSAENPIVLLPMRSALPAVAPHLSQVGLLLPTTPLHVLLLSLLSFPVVATSGNLNGAPILIDERQRTALDDIADAFLDHDRPIRRGVDDSVARVIDDQPTVVRLARGFAPCTLSSIERWAAASEIPIPPMLAVGGQQKNAIALWTGRQAILSAHLGDMDHPETRRGFAAAVDDLVTLYGCEPKVLAGDLHPDYFTTRWAQAAGKPFAPVQHHHAHAVACMAEHGLLDREVLAITWDGTGFGTDGTIWGGEVLRASSVGFERVASLDLFALPGGEAAVREPNRIAFSVLAATYGTDAIPPWMLDRLGLTVARARTLCRMIDRHVNAPRTSSVGRLFDAVAAILMPVQEVTYEGEAALWLESCIDPMETGTLPMGAFVDGNGLQRGDWRPLVRTLVEALANGVGIGICAARFHKALANWATDAVTASNLPDVVLAGGCFQNAWLTHQVTAAIVALGKKVYVPRRVPANDGGLAVGQLAIGMAQWRCQAKEL